LPENDLEKKFGSGLSGGYDPKTGCERVKEGVLKCKVFISGESVACRDV
jgi:hypothetical protein